MMKTEDDNIGAAAAAASGSADQPPPLQSRSRESAASAAAAVAEEVEEAAREEEAATATATALQDLIAGGVAGSASVIVGHPFDTYKVRLQTSAPASSSSKSSSSGGCSSTTAAPASSAAASSKQFGGASSLFRGMSAPLATACVVNAMIFSAFGESSRFWDEYHSSGTDDDGGDVAVEGKPLRRYQTGSGVGVDSDGTAWRGHVSSGGGGHKHHHHHNRHDYADDNVHMHAEGHLTHCNYEDNSSEDSVANDIGGSSSNNNLTKSLVCGSFAGLVQCLVICPMEHVKCRLQVQHGGGGRQKLYRGPLDAVDKIVSGHGVSGLFRGWWVTALREVPAFGLYFATYDDIKDRINRMFEEADHQKSRTGGDVVATGTNNNPPGTHRHSHEWAASAVAGGISGSLTWAIIYPVDVIKSRIQTAPLDCDPSRRKMWTVGRDIVRENGWRYMFRGLGVTLARAFPVNGIIFPVYEFTLMKLTQAGIGG